MKSIRKASLIALAQDTLQRLYKADPKAKSAVESAQPGMRSSATSA